MDSENTQPQKVTANLFELRCLEVVWRSSSSSPFLPLPFLQRPTPPSSRDQVSPYVISSPHASWILLLSPSNGLASIYILPCSSLNSSCLQLQPLLLLPSLLLSLPLYYGRRRSLSDLHRAGTEEGARASQARSQRVSEEGSDLVRGETAGGEWKESRRGQVELYSDRTSRRSEASSFGLHEGGSKFCRLYFGREHGWGRRRRWREIQDELSSPSSSSFPPSFQICSSYNLHPRDVRPVDSNNAISPYIYMGRQNLVATILPRRREALILNLLYLRALIRKDEVLILDSAEGLDSGLHRVYMDNLVVSHCLLPRFVRLGEGSNEARRGWKVESGTRWLTFSSSFCSARSRITATSSRRGKRRRTFLVPCSGLGVSDLQSLRCRRKNQTRSSFTLQPSPLLTP